MKLDYTDKRLLNLLQTDCKLTNKQLSLALNLSTTAIYERVKKLERAKVIDGYVALLDKKKIGKNTMVLCQVKLVQHTKLYLKEFEDSVNKIDEVMECLHITGDYDYILKVLVKDMDAYREFMVTKLTALAHIGSTHSTFVITDIKNSTSIHL